MVKLVEADTFTATVEAKSPQGQLFKFQAEYTYMEKEEADTLAEHGDDAFIEKALVGWRGFRDLERNPIDYADEEQRRAALAHAWVRSGIIATFFRQLNGRRRGN